MSGTYFKPADLGEALRLSAENPRAKFIAGGTYLFASKPETRRDASFISVGSILPKGISPENGGFRLGAGTTFQELLESPQTPRALKSAAAGMATRNIRNRATVGGNLGADKSCAGLLPFFLVAEARLACADGVERSVEEWRTLAQLTTSLPLGARLAPGARLILSISWKAPAGRSFAYAKYSRTASDLAILICAASAEPKGRRLGRLRIAMGGLGSRAARFSSLESTLEGALERPIDGLSPKDKAAVEALAAPFFDPIDDLRGSAAFKRVRAAALLADAIASLEAQA